VLTREEVKLVLAFMEETPALVVKMLYGGEIKRVSDSIDMLSHLAFRYVLQIPIDIAYGITYFHHRGENMTILNVTEARSKLYNLIDETAITHQPITIKGKRSNAVLISEEDWNAITETLYLLSVPSMRESIKNGLKESIESCSKELDW